MQGALKLILEPVFEADFQSGSYGYRPKRTAHQAVERVMKGILLGKLRVIDLDLRAYLDRCSHYTSVCCGWVEEIGKGFRYLYSKAFSTSPADVNGFEFAALYTLQDRLP